MQRLWEVKEKKEKKERIIKGRDLVDVVFSWSVRDVLNSKLYKGKVDKIPNTFQSSKEYFKSFVNPIIEETHAALLSSMETLRRAPAFKVWEIKPAKDFKPPKNLYYEVTLQTVSDNTTKGDGKLLEFNDLIAVTDNKPCRIDDLRCSNEPYLLALVCGVNEDNPHLITILASKPIVFEEGHMETRKKGKGVKKSLSLFCVYLTNMMTNIRIWTALHPDPEGGNLKLISKVLKSHNEVGGESCVSCQENSENIMPNHIEKRLRSFKLNTSQEEAILRCLEAKNCRHSNNIKLIWGPPGTGKTKTTSVLLLNLFKMRCRTLTCAPTNIAVLEVASRVVKLVSESLRLGGYGLGDIVLFGNKERMKIDDREDLFDVFLDYRVDELYDCFQALTGWRANVQRMISLLTDPKEVYRQSFIENDKRRPSFKKFVEKRFSKLRTDLRSQFSTLCLHLPTASLSFQVAEKMNATNGLLRAMKVSDVVRVSGKEDTRKQDCVEMLGSICESIELPDFIGKFGLQRLCLENAYLMFCTASSSAKCVKRSATALDDLAKLQSNKLLSFENSIWKVLLTNEFLKSLETIIDSEINKRVMSVLEKISNGKFQQDSKSENLFRQEDIDDGLSLIWTVDIIKKQNHYLQVLKIWHVLPSSDVSCAEKCLEKHYKRYTRVKIERCRYICSQGNVVVPMRWPVKSCLKNDMISDVSRSFALLSVLDEAEETMEDEECVDD
ncbi:PREDICTED: uncharacterized protein LOC106323254 [Brassica oleracea var. oleracea]|uniref:Uncharacterized protein n=1 Tax=Brassica oleracea var. oleracea TaxID=109376 RepID=A0A0D3ANV4_BRAOL|nr:PREDICTED: uncharacterized protein LOC106323254 [Brassica oleracea var. oleracea]